MTRRHKERQDRAVARAREFYNSPEGAHRRAKFTEAVYVAQFLTKEKRSFVEVEIEEEV